MSDSQTAWTILWNHAATRGAHADAFEIGEVTPALARALAISEPDAQRCVVSTLLSELGRMPEGRQYFAREGNAVVPLPELTRAISQSQTPLDVYPYEL